MKSSVIYYLLAGILTLLIAYPATAQIRNGDFETPSTYDPTNYLNNWGTYWPGWPNTSPNYVQQEESGGNHWAHLHAEGSWSYESYSQQWWHSSAYARLDESMVFVPLDATELTLDYKASITDGTGDGLARPTVQFHFTSDKAELAAAADWTTVSVPIPEEYRGRTISLYLKADDESNASVYDPVGIVAPANNVVDFQVDNLSLNGAQVLDWANWTAAEDAAWENPANWNDGVVPNNTAATAFNVSVPSFGPATVSSDVEVQSLSLYGNDEFRISAGRTVVSREDLSISGRNIVMEAGSTLKAGSDACAMRSSFNGGSITTLAGTGETSLIHIASPYIFSWDCGGDFDTHTGGPTMELTDALVRVTGQDYWSEGGDFSIFDSADVTFTRSAACTGRVGVECRRMLVQHFSTVTFNEGTGAYAGTYVSVCNGTLNLNDAELGGPAEEDQIQAVQSNGTVNITGDLDIHASYDYYAFRSVGSSSYERDALVNITDANVWMNGEFENGNDSTVCISNSTLEVDQADIELLAGSAIDADGASTLICGGFDNQITDAEKFDLSQATLVLSDRDVAVCHLRCQGEDLGADPAGFENNFMLGKLQILGNADLQEYVSHDAALYVGDLYLADGAVLDLNGIPLYYSGSLTGGGTYIDGTITCCVPEPSTLAGLLGLCLAAGSLARASRKR